MVSTAVFWLPISNLAGLIVQSCFVPGAVDESGEAGVMGTIGDAVVAGFTQAVVGGRLDGAFGGLFILGGLFGSEAASIAATFASICCISSTSEGGDELELVDVVAALSSASCSTTS